MNSSTEELTRKELSERILRLCPDWLDTDDAIAGVMVALQDPEERTRPIEHGIGEDGVVYAWREEDASATKLMFEVLVTLGEAFVTGSGGAAKLGFALKELVCFLIDLNRHRVRVSDPVQVSLLLMLRANPAGLTSDAIRQRFVEAYGEDESPNLTAVEDALDALASAHSAAGSKELVRAHGQYWKILV